MHKIGRYQLLEMATTSSANRSPVDLEFITLLFTLSIIIQPLLNRTCPVCTIQNKTTQHSVHSSVNYSTITLGLWTESEWKHNTPNKNNTYHFCYPLDPDTNHIHCLKYTPSWCVSMSIEGKSRERKTTNYQCVFQWLQSWIFTVTIQKKKYYGKTDKLVRSTREYQNKKKNFLKKNLQNKYHTNNRQKIIKYARQNVLIQCQNATTMNPFGFDSIRFNLNWFDSSELLIML